MVHKTVFHYRVIDWQADCMMNLVATRTKDKKSNKMLRQEPFLQLPRVVRRQRAIHCLFLCWGLLMFSPGCASKTPTSSATPDRLLEPLPRDRYADDVGRFLAGFPARTGSPFEIFQNQAAWIRHRRELDRTWSETVDKRLPAMRAFQKAELGGRPTALSRVFYPFSGPDALTATVFFPQSPVYVLVGLEPAGTLPTPQKFEIKDLDPYLAATRAALDSELDRSFFVTRQMDREFRGQVTDGVCLPILELLVRSRHTIVGFRYVRLDDNGHIVERESSYHAPGNIGNKGVEIEFLSDDDSSPHKLFYFSVNLSDRRLQQNPPFLTFLSTLAGSTTFLKATSYMIHQRDFSVIRKQVLQQSAAVLQDDSGVPYRFYLSPSWRVQLYGQYVRPYGTFRYLAQPDLRKAYLAQGPKPLPFQIGYGFKRIPSNLLLATRVD